MDTTTRDEQVRELMMLAREAGQVERRHCIGKAQGFDVRNAYEELESAIRSLIDRAESSEKRVAELSKALRHALEALEYHQYQTRPIAQTQMVIDDIRALL